MKILLYVLLAFGVFCFFSCKRTEKEQLTFLMKEWTRKEILFHDRAVFTIQGKDTLDKFPYASTYYKICLLYTSPSPRDRQKSRMPSSA